MDGRSDHFRPSNRTHWRKLSSCALCWFQALLLPKQFKCVIRWKRYDLRNCYLIMIWTAKVNFVMVAIFMASERPCVGSGKRTGWALEGRLLTMTFLVQLQCIFGGRPEEADRAAEWDQCRTFVHLVNRKPVSFGSLEATEFTMEQVIDSLLLVCWLFIRQDYIFLDNLQRWMLSGQNHILWNLREEKEIQHFETIMKKLAYSWF